MMKNGLENFDKTQYELIYNNIDKMNKLLKNK